MRRSPTRRLAGYLSMPAALALVTLTATPALAAETYQNVSTGFCLDSNTARQVYTNPCGAGNNFQHWNVSRIGNTVQLQNVSTGFCLDSNTNKNVYTNPCGAGNSFQRWTVMRDSNGLQFRNLATGFCLDSNEARAVYTNPCGSGNNFQHWT
jgi:Ricin-type beta-trefoil lectin domain